MKWYQFSDLQWWAAILFLSVWLAGGIGAVEGRLLPAAAPMTVERLEPAEADTLLYGASARLRPSCNFRRIDWKKGTRSGTNVPVNSDLGPAIVRPNGEFSFGPWRIHDIKPKHFLDNSFADVYHRCGFVAFGFRVDFPWLTKTRFWN